MWYFFFLFCVVIGLVQGIFGDNSVPGYKPSRNLIDFFFPGMYD